MELADRDQRLRVGFAARREQRRVPGDFLGRVAQEIRFGPLRPDALDLASDRPGIFSRALAWVFANQLLLVDGRLEAAAQRRLVRS
jgi:hypothetical protein